MTLEPQSQDGDRMVLQLFGAFLMAVGGLIVLLSGLCSLGVLGATVAGFVRSGRAHPSNPGEVSMLISGSVTMMFAVAIFGGVPILCGVAVFLWGRGLYRRS